MFAFNFTINRAQAFAICTHHRDVHVPPNDIIDIRGKIKLDMVEIGAGGGSIARVDALNQITIGPDSAGADPGPAVYGRGGEQCTITDADIHLGRIDPDRFAGGQVPLTPDRAEVVLTADIGEKLDLSSQMAAYGVTEMVDETMANAARVHAVEQGKAASDYTLIAFGGAAPLHALSRSHHQLVGLGSK